MDRTRALFAVALVVVSLAAGPSLVSADTTTLTIAVETRDGAAVADATIVATWDGGSTTATTANNGKAFVDVPEGVRVELVIEHDEFTRNFPYVIQDSSTAASEIVVPVAEKSSLALTLRDSEGVVSDAAVEVRWNGRLVTSQQTGDTGTISLPTIEAGTYAVTVEKPGYYVKETTVSVTNDTETTIEIKSGSVPYEFNVTDSHFDPPRPVAGATLDVAGTGTFNTTQDGLASGRIPVNSEVEMTVTKPGYETVTRTLTVNETGGDVHVDLQRTPGLTVTPVNDRVVAGESVVVTVRNEYQEPVAGATVRRNGTAVGETDENGQAVIALEQPGTWSLDATKDGLTAPAVTVEAIDTSSPTTTTTTTATTSQPDPTDSTATTGVDIPGFGPAIALVGLLAGLGIAHRRGDRR